MISWFEIPVTNMERATTFYETIFNISLTPMEMPDMKMNMFPSGENNTGGALIDSGGFHKPSSTDGALIYLTANPNLQKVLDKIEIAGGKVMMPKTMISPEYGYIGIFVDTEGNRIGLYSGPE